MNVYSDSSPESFKLLERIVLENSRHYSAAI